ncbi:MAG: sialate O-acetylesterase [Lachnospiraceae bacterium]|nr:sialate O-acetylesterase [Lachnospiraceae bacterium]
MGKGLTIPKLLGHGCVLQRGEKTRAWGWAAPGSDVEILLLRQEEEDRPVAARCLAKTDKDGSFTAYFEDLEAGGPYILQFLCGGECAQSRDIWVGDVFVCAGQSNMELPMRRVREKFPEEFVSGCDRVHVYKVQEEYNFNREASDHKNACWTTCVPGWMQRDSGTLKAAGRTEEDCSCRKDASRQAGSAIEKNEAQAAAFAETSAFSYFLGKELSERKGVHIGVLNLSLGGTPIQAWMSEEGLKNWPDYLEERKPLEEEAYCLRLAEQKAEEEAAWQAALREKERAAASLRSGDGNNAANKNISENSSFEKSAVKKNATEKNAEEETARKNVKDHGMQTLDIGWNPIVLPGNLSDAGLDGFCGSLFLRKRFSLPEELAGRGALLRLGTLTDADQTYVNGTFVGETGYCYPPRRYPVPEGVLKAGENEVLIHLVCRNGGGRMTEGKPVELVWEDVCSDSYVRKLLAATASSAEDFDNPDKPPAAAPWEKAPGNPEDSDNPDKPPAAAPWEEAPGSCGGSPAPVSLAGEWEFQVRARVEPAPEQIFLNRGPTGLFNGMAAPCLPYSVKGVVWYQGESNDCRPEDYAGLLPDMIADWRKRWMQERLPFVVVQLPNCGIDIAKETASGELPWPMIREAQRKAGALPDVAVTVNVDIGEDNDLHPLNKKEAARRAALALLRVAYHEESVSSAPKLIGWEKQPGGLTLIFDRKVKAGDCRNHQEKKNLPDGLFELFLEGEGWLSAKADLCGNEIRLTLPRAGILSDVRYAWSNTPGAILLYGEEGLCVSPFCEPLGQRGV